MTLTPPSALPGLPRAVFARQRRERAGGRRRRTGADAGSASLPSAFCRWRGGAGRSGGRSVVAQLHEPGHVEHVGEPPVAGSRQAVADVLAAAASIGEVPVQDAKSPRSGKRATSPTSARIRIRRLPPSSAARPAVRCPRSALAIGQKAGHHQWRRPGDRRHRRRRVLRRHGAAVAVRAGSPTPRNAAEAKPASVSARWRRSARTVPDRSSKSRSPLGRHAPQRTPPAG